MRKRPEYQLADLKIGQTTKTFDLLDRHAKDLFTSDVETPSELIRHYWPKFARMKIKKQTRGKILEALVRAVLIRESLLPYYPNVMFTFVPETTYDIGLWVQNSSKETKYPIVLSVKVSLRERIKQAAHEGLALKQVHWLAESYVLTVNSEEAENSKNKMNEGVYAGLEGIVLLTNSDFDKLIKRLKSPKLCLSEDFPVVSKGEPIGIQKPSRTSQASKA